MIDFNPKIERFETILAKFVDFVEDEAKRIDEEKHGAYRRDGGRKMCCSQFLKQIVSYVEKANNEDKVLEINKLLTPPESWFKTVHIFGDNKCNFCPVCGFSPEKLKYELSEIMLKK